LDGLSLDLIPDALGNQEVVYDDLIAHVRGKSREELVLEPAEVEDKLHSQH
jgi:hypothetical protein